MIDKNLQANSTAECQATLPKLSRVDALIITVGTRQVGWHCRDGVVRCFGADGDRGAPPHINELYKELGIERGYHQEGDPDSRWGVRDLGERFYNHCQESGDFSQVELLLDHQLLVESISLGLNYIILWGTNQPETVTWNYRRSDTLWLAKLMEGKIKAFWPQLKVEVITPILNVKESESIRLELETKILPSALPVYSQPAPNNSFVLAIENTGCAPDIAQGLEICAAALVRQYQVFNIKPEEPKPLYQDFPNGTRSAQTAQDFDFISVGNYFWPLERLRVISAWERGDFWEAEIWLTSHQNRYNGLLYQLASKLALSTNWEIYKFLQDKEEGIESWLQSETLTKWAEPGQITSWLCQLQNSRESEFAQAWESCFIIDLQLYRGNYTTAFMQFAQTLERLLYIYAKEERWTEQGLITLSSSYREPNFYSLINAWGQLEHLDGQSDWVQLLHRIRERRNKIVHSAKPLTSEQVKAVWSDDGLFVVYEMGNATNDIMQLMSEVLKAVCAPNWTIPEKPLLRSLYEWGLHLLNSEPAL
jgi:hypothetical protein